MMVHHNRRLASLAIEQELGRQMQARALVGSEIAERAEASSDQSRRGSTWKFLQLTLAICSLFFALTAVSAQDPPLNGTLTANSVFQEHCAKCHGKTAKGRLFGGPPLASENIAATSTGDLRGIILHGRGRMPKYASKLTTEEIETLVQQIEALNKK